MATSTFSGLLAHDVSSAVDRTSDVTLDALKTFAELHLPETLLSGIHASGFLRPSPVQLKAIPLARLGLDLLVQAKSGTGKTLVFVVAALSGIDPDKVTGLQALVMAPTREIAVQAARVALDVGTGMPGLKVHSFIGGMSVQDDVLKLKRCNLATGTPGRIKQLIEEGYMKTDAIRLLVLDEADKLMEGSFVDDITWIFNHLPTTKQVIATSATYPDELAEVVERYMRNPSHIRLAKEDQVLQGVAQYVLKVKHHPLPKSQLKIKTGALFHVLNTVSFSQCLVFSNYALRAEALCTAAEERGWPAVFIASSQDQRSRLQAINRLKQFQIRVLFSTDLTARGIDAQNVNLVVNADVPWDPATYLHRIGRAGRYGTRAVSVTVASEGEEWDNLRRIVFRTGTKIRVMPNAKEGPEEFDLWKCEDTEMELVEGLEVEDKELDLEAEGSSDNKGKKKRRGKKKKEDVGEEELKNIDESAVDITKAWVEVKRDDDEPKDHQKEKKQVAPRKDHDRNGYDRKRHDIKEVDGKAYDRKKYEGARGVMESYVKKILKKYQESLIPERPPPTLQEIDENVKRYMSGELEEEEDYVESNERMLLNDEVVNASEVFLCEEERKFKEKLRDVSQVIASMTVKEAVEFVKRGKTENVVEKGAEKYEGIAEEEVKVEKEKIEAAFPWVTCCKPNHVVTERGDEGQENARRQQEMPERRRTKAKSSATSGAKGLSGAFAPRSNICDIPDPFSSLPPFHDILPNPDPNRLIPEDPSDTSDSSWVLQWYREVQENKEFIRDMEFLEQMKKV